MERIIKILKILAKHQGKTMLAKFSKYDPYKILIATVLSQRSRDETTESLTEQLFRRYKNVKELANAKQKELEKVIKKSGFYRNKAKNIIAISRIVLEEYHGQVPDDFEKLLEMPGVGRKTAGCVLVYAFNKPALPVDTHVHRVSNRLGLVKTKTPEKTELALMRIVPKKYWVLVNDLLVYHGKSTCKPIRPLCRTCEIERYCRYAGKN